MDEALALSPEQVAATAYATFQHALLAEEFDPFARIPWECRVRWYRVSRLAEDALRSHEGGSFEAAARSLALLWSMEERLLAEHGWDNPRVQLAWQAVARHLANLLELDDVNLAEQEKSWREWARCRLPAPQPQAPEGDESAPASP